MCVCLCVCVYTYISREPSGQILKIVPRPLGAEAEEGVDTGRENVH